jgi:hypothetical protein
MTERKARAKAKAGWLLWFPTLDAKSASRMGHPAPAGIDEQRIPCRNDRKKSKSKSNDWLAFVVSHPRRKERV